MCNCKKFDIPGVEFSRLDSGLEIISVKNKFASAKLTTSGAHIFDYTPNGEKNLLWVSRKSYMTPGKPIRGGVPVCWPWFGPSARPGLPAHGFARIAMWELLTVRKLAGDATQIVLMLDDSKCDPALCTQKFRLELAVTVGRVLELELRAINTGKATEKYQAALHTYFAVGEAEKISLHGLDNLHYFDKAPDAVSGENVQYGDLEIDREIDRVFCPAPGGVTIADPEFRRTIRVEKCGSRSTVVWNPWIAKSRAMADFGDNEFHRMVCVECANVFDDVRTVAPGEMTVMTQKISVEKWD